MVPRDARPLAVRAAAAQGELQRRRGRPGRHPAARPRHEPPLLRHRGGARRAARPTRPSAGPDFSQFPQAAPERRCASGSWRPAPRTLPAAVAPVLVGTALAIHDDEFRRARVRRRAARRDPHPGRDEPLERLLRRAARRRHRGPPRPGARHRRRARAAAAGAHRDLRDVRRSPCSCGSTSSPVAGPGAAARRRRLDPRRRALHGRAAAVRLRGPRRGLRLPRSSASSR